MISPGARLGPYEILGQIGAGGMGEVYRAKDLRLGRDVAIKVLPASFSADPDRLRRFEQEARAAGVLNHPNITAVYDIGTHEDAPYVVQELLEGETLRTALSGGKMAQQKAIDYALQIAHGLAAAHEKGIVHRDLKPENLFVTRDGRLKILDFGLAKLTHQEEGSQVTNLPTAAAGTEPGVVLGTLGYMSPEQVRGRSADARSDIFSFGAILYEMLSGQRAFRGESAADTMSAIPERRPARSFRHQPVHLPGARARRAPLPREESRTTLPLRPRSRLRPRSPVGNIGHERRSDRGGRSQTGPANRKALARRPCGGCARRRRLRRTLSLATLESFDTDVPAADVSAGNIGTPRFAPDGRSVVYSASWEGQPLEIYTARPEGPESTAVGLKNSNLLAVSPSGELAISLRDRFLASPLGTGTLATVPLGGGAPRPLAEFVEWADWTPDGKEVAVVRFLEGRNRLELPLGKVLYSSDHAFRSLRISPKGDRVATLETGPEGRSVVTVDRAGKNKTLAGPGIRGQALTWSSSGEEIWFDDRGERGQYLLRAVDLSGRARTVASSPVGLIAHDIARDGRVLAERFALESGILGLVPGQTHERELSWFDGSEPVGLSDDGRLLLLSETGDAAGRAGAHYLRKTDGSPAVKLGEGAALDLSSDGKWVLARPTDSPKKLVLQPTGPGASISIDLGGLESVGSAVFFPDGKHLLVSATEPGKKRNLYVQDIPTGKPRAISSRGLDFNGHAISPDGHWVAGHGELTDDLVLLPTSGGEPRTVANTKGIDLICWSSDGGSLFAVESGSIPARVVRIEVATGRREPWKTLTPTQLARVIGIDTVLMTPDGQWYAYSTASSGMSDLYLIDGLK